jgi:cytochrome c553
MWGMTSQLDDTMIAALAKYYASQVPTSPQTGGALAAEGNIVADFPLCNKSFNCSYAGHDL